MMITAQVSVYPLGQRALDPPIQQAIARMQAAGLVVEPGAMSTVVAGEADVVFETLRQVFGELAGQGQVIMAVTFSGSSQNLGNTACLIDGDILLKVMQEMCYVFQKDDEDGRVCFSPSPRRDVHRSGSPE